VRPRAAGRARRAVGVAIFGVGALLLAIALAGRDVGAAATPPEALFAASAGLLFGISFGVPAAVVALPLLVAGIDAAAVLGGTSEPSAGRGDAVDLLTFDLLAVGRRRQRRAARAARRDVPRAVRRVGAALRAAPARTVPLMVAGLAAAVALGVALDRAIPALPFVALAFLLPVVDRIPHLLRSEG
jgi:hypothetical protein